eukprot:gene11870-biopygen367
MSILDQLIPANHRLSVAIRARWWRRAHAECYPVRARCRECIRLVHTGALPESSNGEHSLLLFGARSAVGWPLSARRGTHWHRRNGWMGAETPSRTGVLVVQAAAPLSVCGPAGRRSHIPPGRPARARARCAVWGKRQRAQTGRGPGRSSQTVALGVRRRRPGSKGPCDAARLPPGEQLPDLLWNHM